MVTFRLIDKSIVIAARYLQLAYTVSHAMRFFFLKHALDGMTDRKIPRDIVDALLARPEQIVPERKGRKAYQSKVEFTGGRIFLVRAIVDDKVDPAAVVTVYRTSRIEKYWRTS